MATTPDTRSLFDTSSRLMISSVDGLHALIRRRSLRAAEEIRVQFPNLGRDESQRWEERLQRYATSCGCEAGTAFFLVAVIAFLFGASAGGGVGWPDLGLAAVIGLGAALLGKVVGLTYANVRLRSTLIALLHRVSHPEPRATTTSGAGAGDG